VPLGVIVAITKGSPLAGFGSLIAVVVIGLLVCRKEVIGEYKERRGTSAQDRNDRYDTEQKSPT
jgi:hypothetical protein